MSPEWDTLPLPLGDSQAGLHPFPPEDVCPQLFLLRWKRSLCLDLFDQLARPGFSKLFLLRRGLPGVGTELGLRSSGWDHPCTGCLEPRSLGFLTQEVDLISYVKMAEIKQHAVA